MTLSVLTERRVYNPPGFNGGLAGARGKNTLIKENGRIINLGAKTAVPVTNGVSWTIFIITVSLKLKNRKYFNRKKCFQYIYADTIFFNHLNSIAED